MAIDQQTYQRWWNLHLRVARGDKLDSADHAYYESVRQQLEGEETLRAAAPDLGTLQTVIKSLESEHSGLEARRRQLETEIAALEGSLRKSIGQPLGVGD
jgi:septal ring factor EnvC (AmiA/AmiB activator)